MGNNFLKAMASKPSVFSLLSVKQEIRQPSATMQGSDKDLKSKLLCFYEALATLTECDLS